MLHTRIARIGNTSYTFHFMATNKRSRKLVSTGTLTLCWLDDDFNPMRIPDAFREAIRKFEGPLLEESAWRVLEPKDSNGLGNPRTPGVGRSVTT